MSHEGIPNDAPALSCGHAARSGYCTAECAIVHEWSAEHQALWCGLVAPGRDLRVTKDPALTTCEACKRMKGGRVGRVTRAKTGRRSK